MRAHTILDTIGNTPHVRLGKLFPAGPAVWMKLERTNPAGSIKDRIALAMVEDAERTGSLKPGGLIIEPSSGNTGVALAMVAAVKGRLSRTSQRAACPPCSGKRAAPKSAMWRTEWTKQK